MNWGHRLTLVFVVFSLGMSYLAYRSMRINTDLVTKEYYKEELRYQDIIDGTKSANALSTGVQISQQHEMIAIQLPGEMKNEKVSGNIWFYCASDAGKDRHIAIRLNADASQLIDRKLFMPGSYTVKFDWRSNDKHYHSEEPFTIL